MPTYEYRCDNGHTFEKTQSMAEDALDTCEVCGAAAQRILFAPAVHFKGSGFYTTDYARKGSAAKGANGSEGSKSESGESKKSDSKSDSGSSGDSSSSSSSNSDSGSGGSGSSSSSSSDSGGKATKSKD